jgi:hypothetical protein
MNTIEAIKQSRTKLDKPISNKARFVIGTIVGKTLNDNERLRVVGFINDFDEQMFDVQRVGFMNVIDSSSIYDNYNGAMEHYRGVRG